MNIEEAKNITKSLIDTFLSAGDLALSIRKEGLKKEIKSDNTPVTNGDIEVNKVLTKKIKEITPNIPVVSEENSENKKKSPLTLTAICSLCNRLLGKPGYLRQGARNELRDLNW